MGALRPGQMLDGTAYQVVRELGAGGMGVVYEIEHVRLKKRYVAKVIHDQIKNDDGAAKRMEREAQVLATISHPNIVQVHDIGTTQDGVSYFVMEKLEGVDLRTMMKRGLTRLRSIEIITDLLDALEYVHLRGIVHRDIKPENIFLSEQPRGTVTKILDFGIVHIFDKDGRGSQSRITKTGGFVGTLYYAAPEQMQGKPASPPNDIYAAGLVLFELLAGKGPFDDDPGVGLSRCFKPAPLLTDIVPNAPRELSDAVAKALEQDPERRPSAGALATELRAVATALRSNPQVAEDEAIRAEVHDLLRRMPLVDDAPPRPAAGRLPTPAPDEAPHAHGGHGSAPYAVARTPGADVASDVTEVPKTPLMAGAPGRSPSDQRAVFEATLASATGDAHPSAAHAAHPSGAHAAPRLAIGQPPEQAVAAPAPHTPTMLGAGVVPQRQSTPELVPQRQSTPELVPQRQSTPELVPQRQSTPEAVPLAAGGIARPAPQHGSSPGFAAAAPNANIGHSMSGPPPSPRFPATDHGLGPALAGGGFAPGPAAGHHHASQPGQVPPLFATTMPVHRVRAESTPNAPARHGDTSPGLYATVDSQPSSTPLPKRTPSMAIALAAGSLLLVALLIGGAFALKQRSSSTGSTPAQETAAMASAATLPSADQTSEPSSPATAEPPSETSGASSAAPTTTPPAAATATTSASSVVAKATPPPPARTPANAPASKPNPQPGPRPTNHGRAAEHDGYVKSF